MKETKISQNPIYKGRIINVTDYIVQLDNSKQAHREIVHHPGGVCVAAIDQQDNIFFARQFRFPYDKTLLELPAGKLEKGEDPLEAGKRELLEETGIIAESYISLGQLYPTPGFCDEVIWMYLARGLSFSSQNLDDDEHIEVEKMNLDTAIDKVISGQIKDAKTQCMVLKIKLMKEKGLC